MNGRSLRVVLALMLAFAAVAVTPSEVRADFGVVVLEPLPGHLHSRGEAINASGQVAGWSIDPDGVNTAVIWNPNALPTPLLPLEGDTDSVAFGINDAGIAVGTSTGPLGRRAVRWAPSGHSTALAEIGSHAFDINNSGVIVGSATNSLGEVDTVLWLIDGTTQVLSDPAGYDPAMGFALNERRQVIGEAYTFTSIMAVLWQPNGNSILLPPLPGDNNTEAFKTGITNKGVTVGGSFNDTSFISTAVVWDTNRMPRPLSPLPGEASSLANGINERLQVVGDSWTSGSGEFVATLWQPNGQVIELSPLAGHVSSSAVAINRMGWVLGSSWQPDESRAVIWMPVRS